LLGGHIRLCRLTPEDTVHLIHVLASFGYAGARDIPAPDFCIFTLSQAISILTELPPEMAGHLIAAIIHLAHILVTLTFFDHTRGEQATRLCFTPTAGPPVGYVPLEMDPVEFDPRLFDSFVKFQSVHG
jgi:hypothetical protein